MLITATYRKPYRGRDYNRNLFFNLPTKWEEVKINKLISIAMISMDDTLFKMALLKTAFGKYFSMLSLEQIDDYIQLYLSSISLLEMPSFYLLPNGPEDKFEFETLRTLMYMQGYIDEYMEGDKMAIWRMTALLRLRAKKRLHLKQIDALATRLYKWRYIRKLYKERAAAIAYTLGSLRYIQSLYKTTIFRPGKGSSLPDAIHFGWYEIAHQVAKTNVYNDVQDVLDSEFHDVASHLIIEQQQEDQRIANAELHNH